MSADPNLAPASPCVSVCQLDDANALCIGCGRLIAEIAEWPAASEDRRWQILKSADTRRRVIEASALQTTSKNFQHSFASESGPQ
jgi:predicted Fe-S protein YdhL (DUF1289 family)